MSWNIPRVDIVSLNQSEHETGELATFVATTTGFTSDDIEHASFVFVHAGLPTARDGDPELADFMVVPCQNLRLTILASGQTVAFDASFYQRAPGSYHLAAWVPSEEVDGHVVNNAATLENALAFRVA